MSAWWEADEYAKRAPMVFPDPDPGARVRRVPLTTDAVMELNDHGALRLRLVNRHPHESRRIFVGPSHR